MEVKIYTFNYKIGEHTYGGQIPATSWDDAQSKVKRFGATVDGELVGEILQKVKDERN